MPSDTDKTLIDDIVAAVRSVVPHGAAALHEPEFRGNERAYVTSCIDDNWVSTAGPFVTRFEDDLARVSGRAAAVACVNGTAALHAALLCVGVGPGDEVLVPSLTFVATANAVHHAGAVPHFVDCEEDSLGISPQALETHLFEKAVMGDGVCRNRDTGRRIAALVPVHVFGHPARMDTLCAIAGRYGLTVVEDATEALGSLDGGLPVGGHGVVSVLSFNGNKIITTGGGGAILTDDRELAARARHLTTTAKVPHRWAFVHDEVGYNYRLPNLNAALGCAQLERLADFVARKRRLAEAYEAAFAGVTGAQFLRERPGTSANYWLQAILLQRGLEHMRNPVLEALNAEGLQCRPAWEAMHLLPYHRDCPIAPMSMTDSICARLINIPSSPRLADGMGG